MLAVDNIGDGFPKGIDLLSAGFRRAEKWVRFAKNVAAGLTASASAIFEGVRLARHRSGR